jgi:Tfp pilus assembly protein PilF
MTTNFDDLIADAHYIYGACRPTVLGHDALMAFVRVTNPAPLVIKLHGEAHFDLRNTEVETSALGNATEQAVREILSEREIVFIGYSGGDKSIINVLKNIDADGMKSKVYWINDSLPSAGFEVSNEFRTWLINCDAIHVSHLDFDELMLALRKEFKLPFPNMSRFQRIRNRHYKVIVDAARDVVPTFSAIQEAFGFDDLEFSDVELAFRHACDESRNDANLLGLYALILWRMQKKSGEAERIYRCALEADGRHVDNICNFATFLRTAHDRYDEAEALYKVALGIDKRNANTLAWYANFLYKCRKDIERARCFYQEAVEVDSTHVDNLGNFAGFLLAIGDLVEGKYYLGRAKDEVKACRKKRTDLALELCFYEYAHFPDKRADALEEILRRLSNGDRSEGFDLSATVEAGQRQGHPEPELLAVLARCIAEKPSPEKPCALENNLGERQHWKKPCKVCS